MLMSSYKYPKDECPHGCDFVEVNKQQWHGGWCEHWCAKCGYDCLWEDLISYTNYDYSEFPEETKKIIFANKILGGNYGNSKNG